MQALSNPILIETAAEQDGRGHLLTGDALGHAFDTAVHHHECQQLCVCNDEDRLDRHEQAGSNRPVKDRGVYD